MPSTPTESLIPACWSIETPKQDHYAFRNVHRQRICRDWTGITAKKERYRNTYQAVVPACDRVIGKVVLPCSQQLCVFSRRQGHVMANCKKTFSCKKLSYGLGVRILPEVMISACDESSDSFHSQAPFNWSRVDKQQARLPGYFYCGRCDYVTINKSNLVRHERTHTGEKPFTCEQCQKSFGRREHLEAHLETHSNLKPYECPECGQHFSKTSNLARHRLQHLGGSEHLMCPDCGRTFNRSDSLQRHRKVHTGERPYACHVCGMRFAHVSTVRRHEQKVHCFPHSPHESTLGLSGQQDDAGFPLSPHDPTSGATFPLSPHDTSPIAGFSLSPHSATPSFSSLGETFPASPHELNSPSKGVGPHPPGASPVLPQQGGETFLPACRESAGAGDTPLREGRGTGQQAAPSAPVKDEQEQCGL